MLHVPGDNICSNQNVLVIHRLCNVFVTLTQFDTDISMQLFIARYFICVHRFYFLIIHFSLLNTENLFYQQNSLAVYCASMQYGEEGE